MKTRTRLAYLSVSGVLVVALGAVFACILIANAERHQAERMLSVLQEIQVGTTDRGSVLHLVSPLQSHMQESLREGQQELTFWFDNRWLSRWKLAPRTFFWAHIILKDGVVVEKGATEFAQDSGCAGKVRERLRGFGFENGTAPATFPHRIISGNWNSPTSRGLIVVEHDESVDAVQRRKDWKFNLNCLTQFGGGCSDAREMLPDVPVPPYGSDIPEASRRPAQADSC